jgi:hypothetical protein
MRALFGLLLGVMLMGLAVPGCGPRVPAQDLGTCVFEIQDLPGGDQPYKLPSEAKGPSAKPAEGSTHEAHPHE